jgi:3-dehydroquinate dehydratase-1
MLSRKISQPAPGSVVGTVHSHDCLRMARKLRAGAVDFLEIRLDAFAREPDTVLRSLPQLKFPLIFTVRHPREGGQEQLSVTEREKLYAKFLPNAALIDLELRSLHSLRRTIDAARARDVAVIISYHNFRKTPSLERLRQKSRASYEAGADIFKVATKLDQPRDLLSLLTLVTQKTRLPLSVMGMGTLGKISRLLFAKSGSVLNYGYLGRAQVAGQWPADLLKRRIEELG